MLPDEEHVWSSITTDFSEGDCSGAETAGLLENNGRTRFVGPWVASILRGALPPVVLRAVCLVRAIVILRVNTREMFEAGGVSVTWGPHPSSVSGGVNKNLSVTYIGHAWLRDSNKAATRLPWGLINTTVPKVNLFHEAIGHIRSLEADSIDIVNEGRGQHVFPFDDVFFISPGFFGDTISEPPGSSVRKPRISETGLLEINRMGGYVWHGLEIAK